MEIQKQTTVRNIVLESGFELLTAVNIIFAVLYFWNNTAMVFALLFLGLVFQLIFWKGKTDIATMIVAAFLGTVSEIVCVTKGLWTYEAPILLMGIPVWLPLVWANLFNFFRRTTMTLIIFLDWYFPQKKTFFQKIFFSAAILLILIYSVFTLLNIKWSFALVYLVFAIIAAIFWRRRNDILVFIIGAICGTTGEYFAMKLGYWYYHFPHFKSIGLPLSLPLAWGLSAVIISRIAGISDTASRRNL